MTTMLQMGIDDPELLAHAKTIVSQPMDFLSKLTGESDVERKSRSKKKKKKKATAPPLPLSEDDDEAPPPVAEEDEEAPPPPC